MSLCQRLLPTGNARNVVRGATLAASTAAQYGRTAAYRRISTQGIRFPCSLPLTENLSAISPRSSSRGQLIPPRQSPEPFALTQPARRLLHYSSGRFQQTQHKEDIKDPPREGDASQAKGEEDGQSSKEESADTDSKSQKDSKKDAPPPPPHGDKSPWQVFRDTLSAEFKSSKEWNESTKQLASSAHQFTESDAVRRARAATDAATSTTAKVIKTTGQAIGTGAAWTWETPVVKGIRQGVNATASGVEQVTRPIRETETFKNISEAVDDGSSSKYGGWLEKEERRKRKERRDLQEGRLGRGPAEKMEEDPDAGTNITLHKDSAWKESWNKFKDNSKVMQSLFNMKNTYQESENPLISTARSISDRVAGFFAENETAMVIKKFREMDPHFQIEPFLRDLREYILPEVLDAYVKGDVDTLKLWLSEAQFQVYSALMKQYTTAGLKSDGRILDIRGVDILNARMLEPGEIPVFIITCRTQEVHVYRNAKTNQLAAGMEDRVQLVTYAIGVTRLPEDVNNPETRGWRMIELQKAGRDYI